VFAPDQLVVYPAQGVGRVERVERRDIGEVSAEFYIIRILANNVTLMVPVKNAANVGLRPLCSRERAFEVLDSLKDRSGYTGHIGQNWNRRYREYSEKLKSGDIADVCHVLKELLLISGEKELSFGERRLMEQAMSLVTMELACVLGHDPADMQTRVESFFADVLLKTENEE
jgi:CarD family transcriptional regulator